MISVESRRKLTEQAIKINPMSIVLRRKERIYDGAGGWIEDEEKTLDTQVFRLYISSQATKNISREGGTFQIITWEMLCPHGADIKRDDTFELDDNVFIVVEIKPVRLKGEIVSFQAVVAELDDLDITAVVDDDDNGNGDDNGDLPGGGI